MPADRRPPRRRDEADECECNYCGVTSATVPTLTRSEGRACPFCGEGVIRRIDHA
jgi:uncharacterized paraquat-inducible protein A